MELTPHVGNHWFKRSRIVVSFHLCSAPIFTALLQQDLSSRFVWLRKAVVGSRTVPFPKSCWERFPHKRPGLDALFDVCIVVRLYCYCAIVSGPVFFAETFRAFGRNSLNASVIFSFLDIFYNWKGHYDRTDFNFFRSFKKAVNDWQMTKKTLFLDTFCLKG